MARNGVPLSSIIGERPLYVREYDYYLRAAKAMQINDQLSIFEAVQLAHPADKKTVDKINRRLSTIQKEFNDLLSNRKEEKLTNFWDAIKDPKLRTRIQNV